MRQLKSILYEGILAGADTVLAQGQDALDDAMGIPTMDDFYKPRSSRDYSLILWQCKDKLTPYKNARWMPDDCPGITFMIFPGEPGDDVFNIEFCMTQAYLPNGQFRLAPPLHNKRILDWKIAVSGKNRTYCKKVVLSLIRHLAENPKAFKEFMHYIDECRNHRSAEQSYHTGKSMPTRNLMELMKIKG